MTSSIKLLGCSACLIFTGAVHADIVGVTQVRYMAHGIDAHGAHIRVAVADLYLTSDDATDVVVNAYNGNISNSAGAGSYYQSVIGETWNPLRSDVATEAWQRLDSFVTLGGVRDYPVPGILGPYQELVATSTIDPSFGGLTTPAPATNAGWFNSNPTNLNGTVGETDAGLGLFVGRFSLEDAEIFYLEGDLSVTWNAGLQTPPSQGTFDIAMGTVTAVPGVGGILLFAATPIRRRRRRH